MLAWLQSNYLILIGIIYWVLNEIVAANPSLKSNSLFQVVMGVLGSLGPKTPPIVPPTP